VYTTNGQTNGPFDASKSTKFGTVSATAISDGTSNTLMVAEKAVSAQQYNAKVWDWWELPGWAHGADWPNMRLAGNWIPPMPDNQTNRISWTNNANGANWYWEPGFGSAHSGVFLAVFGDGSVKPLSFNIPNGGNGDTSNPGNQGPQYILYNLGKRNDGQVIGNF